MRKQQPKPKASRGTKNKAIIDSILRLLEKYKIEMVRPKSEERTATLGSLRYLVYQSIRHYDLPKTHRHLSRRAHERWNELSSEDIMKKHFRDKVVCDRLGGIVKRYKLYKGSSKAGVPTDITAKGFQFRQMFHEEHVIPVKLIFKAMIEKKTMGERSLKILLDKMHICVLLKEEDRLLPGTKGRCLDFETTIRQVYHPAGIRLLPGPKR